MTLEKDGGRAAGSLLLTRVTARTLSLWLAFAVSSCGGSPHGASVDGLQGANELGPSWAVRSPLGLLAVAAAPSRHATPSRTPDRCVADACLYSLGTISAAGEVTVIGPEVACVRIPRELVMIRSAAGEWNDAWLLDSCTGPDGPLVAFRGSFPRARFQQTDGLEDASLPRWREWVTRAGGRVDVDEDLATLDATHAADLVFLVTAERERAAQADRAVVLRVVRGEQLLFSLVAPPGAPDVAPTAVVDGVDGATYVLLTGLGVLEVRGDRVRELARGLIGA